MLVAGIDEDTGQPFALNVNTQDLSSRFISILRQTIYYRKSPDENEIRLSPELAGQVSLSFVIPRPSGQSKHTSPVAIVTVRSNPALCGYALFAWRHLTPTTRGEVWRRADGHCVKVDRRREMSKLYDQLCMHSNNSTPSQQ